MAPVAVHRRLSGLHVKERRVTIAHRLVGCVLAVPMLALGAMQATSVLAHEERTERTDSRDWLLRMIGVSDSLRKVKASAIVTVRGHSERRLSTASHIERSLRAVLRPARRVSRRAARTRPSRAP